MNAVFGMTHLALSADPPTRVKEYLRKLRASGQHLLGVLKEMPDFSKIDAGKMEIERTESELEKVLQETVGLIAGKCSEKGIELVVDLPFDIPRRLVGDPLQIEKVPVNYLNNTVKFTDRGEIVLRANAVERHEQKVTLRFEVQGTGVGIPTEMREQLFRAFQQVESSTTRRHGGTGLGLAIAKLLAEAMGGRVGVDSEPNVDSTFWFTAKLIVGGSKAELKWVGISGDDGQHIIQVPPPPATEKYYGEIPANFPGLDFMQGLRRILGNKGLYRSLLRKFACGHKSVPAQIGLALSRSDWPLAQGLAHTLKGVAGNIGASAVSEISAALDSALAERRPVSDLNPLLTMLNSKVKKMVNVLSLCLSATDPSVAGEVDLTEIDQVCSQLVALLAQNDAEAAEALKSNGALHAAALPCQYNRIEPEVDVFEFDSALSTLKNAGHRTSPDEVRS